ncbi:hypothetical protein SSAG_00771 [Streptomyces sp. Mg1]|nr:hypothetical protein SSAG_00771 [Streptomyces sp. Mg1]
MAELPEPLPAHSAGTHIRGGQVRKGFTTGSQTPDDLMKAPDRT